MFRLSRHVASYCLMMVAAFALCSCSGSWRTLRDKKMGYSLELPKTWNRTAKGTFRGPGGVTLMMRVTRDRNPLEQIADATKKSFPEEIPTYNLQDEGFVKVARRKAFFIRGSYQSGGDFRTTATYIVDFNKLKYFLTFEDSPKGFKKKKELFRRILSSLEVSAETD